jgi:hypothetical protein
LLGEQETLKKKLEEAGVALSRRPSTTSTSTSTHSMVGGAPTVRRPGAGDDHANKPMPAELADNDAPRPHKKSTSRQKREKASGRLRSACPIADAYHGIPIAYHSFHKMVHRGSSIFSITMTTTCLQQGEARHGHEDEQTPDERYVHTSTWSGASAGQHA